MSNERHDMSNEYKSYKFIPAVDGTGSHYVAVEQGTNALLGVVRKSDRAGQDWRATLDNGAEAIGRNRMVAIDNARAQATGQTSVHDRWRDADEAARRKGERAAYETGTEKALNDCAMVVNREIMARRTQAHRLAADMIDVARKMTLEANKIREAEDPFDTWLAVDRATREAGSLHNAEKTAADLRRLRNEVDMLRLTKGRLPQFIGKAGE